MVMVSSAVLGAAAGTGLALLLAVTIVMYRYYLLRKRGKVSTSTYNTEHEIDIFLINLLVNHFVYIRSGKSLIDGKRRV